jgi:biopolymer transport protein ExbB/TolQ
MQSLSEFIAKGGFFMYCNILVSVMTVAIIAERVIYFLGRSHVNARAFLDQIRKLVGANNIDRAVKLCSATPAPVARVAKAGLTRIHKGEAAVSMAIEETLIDVTPDLKKRVSSLWSLANIATLLGLLGTISGLIKTFAALGSASPADRAKLLSDGISEAMNNTAVGLAIAVVCMIGHLFLSGISRREMGELEGFALKLENLLTEAGRQTSSQAPAGAER